MWVVNFSAKIPIEGLFSVCVPSPYVLSIFCLPRQYILNITLAVFTTQIYFVAKNTPNANGETFSFKLLFLSGFPKQELSCLSTQKSEGDERSHLKIFFLFLNFEIKVCLCCLTVFILCMMNFSYSFSCWNPFTQGAPKAVPSCLLLCMTHRV